MLIAGMRKTDIKTIFENKKFWRELIEPTFQQPRHPVLQVL
jgi:hypothetical protein